MNANEIYFTRGTKRAQRLGDTLIVVTEGARVTITLQPNGQPAKVTVAKATPRTATATATAPKATPATAPKATPATAPKATPATPRATTRKPATRAAAPKATPATPATARTTRRAKVA